MPNINQYNDNGFISNIKILDKSTCNDITNNYENFFNKNSFINRCQYVEHKSKTHLYFDWANNIIFNDRIINYVTSILGNNIVCWNSLIFYKKPYSKSFVSMHQDQNYWGINKNKALTVSLALTESNIENGCLRLLPKSHLKDFTHTDYQNKDNMLARGQSIDERFYNENELQNIILKEGEACIFNSNIAHGSLPNNSNKTRFLYAMRFLTTDNKVNTSLYYNYATLVSGKDNFGFFKNEKSLINSNLKEMRKLHKKIIISQFSRYLNLKIKINILTKLFMIFFRLDFLRGFVYFLVNKT